MRGWGCRFSRYDRSNNSILITMAVQVFIGDDEYFVERKAQQYIAQYFNYLTPEILDGEMGNVSEMKNVLGEMIECMRTLDFFSTAKCIWLRATNLFASTGPAVTESGQEILQSWQNTLLALPDDVHVVISAHVADKRTKLYKWIQQNANVEVLEGNSKESCLEELIQGLKQECHVQLEPQAFQLLCQKLNEKPRLIEQEFRKLACLNGFQGTITYDMVMHNTLNLPNEEFFEPVEAFFSGDLAWFRRSLKDHFTLNKEVRSILTMIQNRTRLLLQMAALRQTYKMSSFSKVSFEQWLRNHPQLFGSIVDKNTFCIFSQNPWYISRLTSNFSPQVLKSLPLWIVDAFDQLLAAPKNACAIMERLAEKCCMKK